MEPFRLIKTFSNEEGITHYLKSGSVGFKETSPFMVLKTILSYCHNKVAEAWEINPYIAAH